MLKMFKRALASLVVALTLGACVLNDVAEFTNLPPSVQVYVLKSQFDLNLDALKAYRNQPACSPTVVVGCYEPKVYNQLVDVANEADSVLDAAEAAVGAGNASDAASKIDAARSLVNSLANRLIAEEIVKK